MNRTLSRRAMMLGSAGLALLPLGALAACDDADEANKKTVFRFVEDVLNGGNLDLVSEIGHPDYVPTDPDSAPGLDAWRARLEDRRTGYLRDMPDYHQTIDEMIAADGAVVVRGFLQGSTATGKKLDALAMDIYHFRDGKIATIWSLFDYDAVMRAFI